METVSNIYGEPVHMQPKRWTAMKALVILTATMVLKLVERNATEGDRADIEKMRNLITAAKGE